MSKPQTIVVKQKSGCSDGCALIIIIIVAILGVVVWTTMQAGKAIAKEAKRQEAEKKQPQIEAEVAPKADEIPWE